MLFATVSRGKNLGTRLLPHRSRTTAITSAWANKAPIFRSPITATSPRTWPTAYSLEMSNKAESHNPA